MAVVSPIRFTVCGFAELKGSCDLGASHVLSLLDPGIPAPPELDRVGSSNRVELRFHDVIDALPQTRPPAAEDIEQILALGSELALSRPSHRHLLIHCHAGISRSTSAAALLWAQGEPSRSPTDIFAEIGRRRPRAWPNLLLLEYGEAALGRAGEIVPAAAMQYRRVLAEQPQFAQMMRECGRGREVDLAERSAQR